MMQRPNFWTGPTKRSVQQSKKPYNNNTISAERLIWDLIYNKIATEIKHFQKNLFSTITQKAKSILWQGYNQSNQTQIVPNI